MKMASMAVGVAMFAIAGASIVGCGDSSKATPESDNTNNEQHQNNAKETPFVVTVPHMQDEGCVASINGTVSKVSGVDSIECDIPNKKAKVYPKKGATISMKELWEAFDEAGESASKIDGPMGMITAKPDK